MSTSRTPSDLRRREMEEYYDAQSSVFRSWAEELGHRLLASVDRRNYEDDMGCLDRALAEGISSARRIAEVGCGPSRLPMLPVSQRITLIDPAPSMLRAARARHGSCNRSYLRARVEALPLREGTTDFAICAFVLSHLSMPVVASALHELQRILRPQGLLLIADSARSIPPTGKSGIQVRQGANGRRYRVPKQYRPASHIMSGLRGGTVSLLGEPYFVYTVLWRKS